jgi:hypothetical protein
MSVRDKLVELAYVRWELRQRADMRESVDTAKRAAALGRTVYPTHPATQMHRRAVTTG